MKRKVIAVTGGIGSGKSTVINILRRAGYATIDCDELAREVAEYPEVAENVRNLLGDGYVIECLPTKSCLHAITSCFSIIRFGC